MKFNLETEKAIDDKKHALENECHNLIGNQCPLTHQEVSAKILEFFKTKGNAHPIYTFSHPKTGYKRNFPNFTLLELMDFYKKAIHFLALETARRSEIKKAIFGN